MNNPPGAPQKRNSEISGNRRNWIRRGVTRPARGVAQWQTIGTCLWSYTFPPRVGLFIVGISLPPPTQKYQARYVSSRCVLVLSSVLVCSVLVCSRLAFFPLSSIFPSVFLPRGGGWSRFCSVVIPPFLRLSLLCLPLFFNGVTLFSYGPPSLLGSPHFSIVLLFAF